MSAGLSLYFDLLRSLAALAVVLFHLWPILFPRFPLPWPGHAAVMVFFVLSGYMMAHVCHRPGASLAMYARHRAVRILSVALPALLLSAAIAPAVGSAPLHSSGPMDLSAAEFMSRLAASLFFVAQSWTLELVPPYNQPYWSLCYEVWYYVIYGAWVFLPARRRWVAALVGAFCAGPKIMLLMPVWLLGVAVYHAQRGGTAPAMPPMRAWLVFWLCALAAFLVFWLDVGVVLRNWMAARWPLAMRSLHESAQFAGDYLMALAVAGNFFAAQALGQRLRPLLRFESLIRGAASYSFSVYLYHMPLAILLWNGLGLHAPLLFLPALAMMLLLLGQLTERQLPFYRKVLRHPAA